MKYQALYDITLRDGGVTIDLKDGAALGYGRKLAKGFIISAVDGPWLTVATDDPEAFDTAIERFLTQMPSRDIVTHLTTLVTDFGITIDPVRVVADKGYAVGWSEALGFESIYDLEKSRAIVLRQKKEKK